jgi:hypothetical protein
MCVVFGPKPSPVGAVGGHIANGWAKERHSIGLGEGLEPLAANFLLILASPLLKFLDSPEGGRILWTLKGQQKKIRAN